jgi:hypothetical protein
MQKLRRSGDKIAEVSAFAMDRNTTAHRKLIFFLMSFAFQYCFYYTDLDRLVASCKPEHADFYESVLCFSKISALTYYDYSHALGYLVSLNLLEAHQLLSTKYPPDPTTGESFYRFLMCDPQPCQRFSPALSLKRPRDRDWVRVSIRKIA